MGLVLRAQGAGTSSVGSCPRGQQGPHRRVTSCTWAPRGHGSSQLRATTCLSVPAALSWCQCPDPTSNQGQRDGHTKKNELPSGTSTSRDTWTRDERPLQRLPHCPQNTGCSPWKRGAGKDPLSPSVSFKNVPWCVIWQFQHFELNYGN